MDNFGQYSKNFQKPLSKTNTFLPESFWASCSAYHLSLTIYLFKSEKRLNVLIYGLLCDYYLRDLIVYLGQMDLQIM